MRISDWSSDVCSSDLSRLRGKVVGNKVVPYPSREELMRSNALAGDEILWVDDPIDAFFLQVQGSGRVQLAGSKEVVRIAYADQNGLRSEEHTSELQSLMRISYAVFCLQKKKNRN